MSAAPHAAARDPFDGILCFGSSDWWYHNRGRVDVRLMAEFSQRVPVLYLNSIGMRFPSPAEGAVFARRIGRKLASLRRGVVAVGAGMRVWSPLTLPGRFGPVARAALARQLRRQGVLRALVWVALPLEPESIRRLSGSGIVYQRTDRYEEFPGVDRALIARRDRALKQLADLTLFSSYSLFERERDQCRRAAFLDHAVEYERFASVDPRDEPDDLRGIPRPRIGFLGSMDAHTFDDALLAEVARRLPDCHFVLVGESTLPRRLARSANLHALGRKPYDEVWRYPACCDVLIMPLCQNEWVRVCNPIKLKEYLAAGRPVVTTAFDDLARYRDCVYEAAGPAAFAEAIRRALADAGEEHTRRLRARVRGETWSARAEEALELVRKALPA